MEKRNRTSKRRRLLWLVFGIFAVCAWLSAMPGGMQTVEAKQAIKLTKSQVRLVKGEKLRLRLRGAKGKAVWKSKDKAVASVDKNGIVRAKKSGKTRISVKYRKKAYLCTVWVEAPKLNKKSMSLEEGAKAQLKISGTQQKVSWSSGQKKIATVNKKGVVTAKKPGKATITAKVGTKKYQCKVTVKAKEEAEEAPGNGNESVKPGNRPGNGEGPTEPGNRPGNGEGPTEPGNKPGNGNEPTEPGNKPGHGEEPGSGEEPTKPGKEPGSGDGKAEPLKAWIEEGKEIPYRQSTITLVTENPSNVMQMVTYGYTFWMKQDGKWVPAPVNFMFPDVMEEIQPGETDKITCSLEDAETGEKLQPGEYYVSRGQGVRVYFRILEDKATEPTGKVEMQIQGESRILIGQPYLTVCIKNDTAETVSYDRYYEIDRLQGAEWVQVPLGYYFTDDMVDVAPGETWEIRCPLRNGASDYFPPGQYRFEKGYFGNESHVEFEIVAEPFPVDGWKVSIEEGNAVPKNQKSITLAVENLTDATGWMNSTYTLEWKQDSQWVTAPMNPEPSQFLEPVEPGAAKKIKCYLQENGQQCQPGEYRISRGSEVCAEFQILGEEGQVLEPASDLTAQITQGTEIDRSKKFLLVILRNATDTTEWYRYCYELQRKDGDTWVPMSNNYKYSHPLMMMRPGESMSVLVDLAATNQTYPLGEYRICISDRIYTSFWIVK